MCAKEVFNWWSGVPLAILLFHLKSEISSPSVFFYKKNIFLFLHGSGFFLDFDRQTKQNKIKIEILAVAGQQVVVIPTSSSSFPRNSPHNELASLLRHT